MAIQHRVGVAQLAHRVAEPDQLWKDQIHPDEQDEDDQNRLDDPLLS